MTTSKRDLPPSAKQLHTIVERLDADHRTRIVFVVGDASDRVVTQKEFRARMWCLVQLRRLGYFKPPRRSR